MGEIIPFLVWIIPFPVLKINFEPLKTNEKHFLQAGLKVPRSRFKLS